MTDSQWPLCRGYYGRKMRRSDLEALSDIDRRADQLFLGTGIANIMAIATGPMTPLAEFDAMLADCTVTVACSSGGIPVGLSAVQRLQDDIYLRLLAVDPDHGRRGIGSSLLSMALDHGQKLGAGRCALSTFRDVSFNAPYYQRHGFTELPLHDASTQLRHRFEDEIPDGVDATQRLLMVRDL